MLFRKKQQIQWTNNIDEWNQLRKKYRLSSILCICLCVSLLFGLTGCGKTKDAAPELLEPVTTNRLYRPVIFQEVNEEAYHVATVVPKIYSQFYTFSGKLKQVYVSEGDHIKKGDLIAELESKDEVQSQERLSRQMSYEATIKRKQEAVDALELKLQKENHASKKELQLAKEQARYNQSMTGVSQQQAASKIAEDAKHLQETKLYADHDGVVAYVCDMELTDTLSSGEMVAMIADFEEPYLEVSDLTLQDDDYKDALEVYVETKDEKIALEPYAYSDRELAYMASMNCYANAKYQIPKALKTSLGEQWILRFVMKKGEKGCYIGSDSLQEEGQDNFCFVKTETGEEKRHITIGERIRNQVRVLDGLEEGEQVAYQNVSLMPDTTNTIDIAYTDYQVTFSGGSSSYKDDSKVKCVAPITGTVSKIYVKEKDQVKTGDPIYSIKQVAEKSDVMAVNAQSSKLQSQHKETMDAYNKELKGYTKQKNKKSTGKKAKKILDIQIDLCNARKELETANYQWESQNLQWAIADLKKENDGSGEKIVRATCDGVISAISVLEDANVKEGQAAYTLGVKQKKHLVTKLSDVVEITDKNTPKLGDTISYKTANGEDTGICVTNHLQNFEQIVTKDEQVYKTFSSNMYPSRIFVMESGLDQDAKETLPSEINYLGENIKDAYVVPTAVVSSEQDVRTAQTVYFVWKVVDGTVVKQYVTLEEEMLKSERVIIYDGIAAGDVLASRS